MKHYFDKLKSRLGRIYAPPWERCNCVWRCEQSWRSQPRHRRLPYTRYVFASICTPRAL